MNNIKPTYKVNFPVIFFILSITLIMAMNVPAVRAETKLDYRLKWLFNTSVAGDIYADAKGFFKAEDLAVAVKEGSPEKDAIKELELGYADFGVASADQVIRALDKGADIYVIAQLFQVSPMQWIYRTDNPEIKTLEDLKGRNIGITFGGNDEIVMNTLFAMAGITKEDVTITGVRFDFTPFFKRQVEVWPVYKNSQGVILKDKLAEEGEDIYFFNPASFGVNFVANSVITSGKMIEKNPETVAKFLKALLAGWEASMDPDNEAVALEVVKTLDKGNNDDIRKKQLIATRELIKPTPQVKIGTIDVDAWKQTEDIMLKANQIKQAVNVETRLIQVK